MMAHDSEMSKRQHYITRQNKLRTKNYTEHLEANFRFVLFELSVNSLASIHNKMTAKLLATVYRYVLCI